MKKSSIKILTIACIALSLFFVFSPFVAPHVAFAAASSTITGGGAGTTSVQNPNFFSCSTSPATCGVYYISLTINGIMALALSLGAWLVQLGLGFNNNIFNSPAVQTGFSIMLSLANLGFVLGIIIIAIATILRNQTYGIKQLLWKLVVMAVLVNFGLVITAPIVGFADSMSNYFLDATSPSVATGGYAAYVETLTSAFNPQTLLLSGGGLNTSSQTGTATAPPETTFCQGNWSYVTLIYAICHITGHSTSNPADNFWQSTMALAFDVAFSAITTFTFFCLAILLLVRYLILGGLLIVLPLAWLTFIFPKFDNNFSKWWNTFIKWTLFPPLALFFIYLAFIAAVNTNPAASTSGGSNASYAATAIAGGNNNSDVTLEQGIANQTGIAGQTLVQAADEILLAGLMIMGLLFASSLSGKAGSTVVNGVAHGASATSAWIGKKAKKGARSAIQKAGGDTAVKNLKSGFGGRLQKVPVVGWAASRATSKLGRAVEPHLSNKEFIEKAKTKVPESPESIKQNLKGNMSKDDYLAHVAKLVEKGELTRDTMVGDKTATEFLDENADAIAVNGLGKMQKDADKILGSNKAMRTAQKELEQARAKGSGIEEAEEAKSKVAKDFFVKMDPKDLSMLNVNDAFKKDNPFGPSIMEALITTRPSFASKAMPRMRPEILESFRPTYANKIKELRNESGTFSNLDTMDEELKRLAEAKRGEDPQLEELKSKKARIEMDIKHIKNIVGDEQWKKERVRRKNEELARVDVALFDLGEASKKDKKEIQEKIDEINSKRKAIIDGFTEEERNIEVATNSFKKLPLMNALGGHDDHGGGSGSVGSHDDHH